MKKYSEYNGMKIKSTGYGLVASIFALEDYIRKISNAVAISFEQKRIDEYVACLVQYHLA